MAKEKPDQAAETQEQESGWDDVFAGGDEGEQSQETQQTAAAAEQQTGGQQQVEQESREGEGEGGGEGQVGSAQSLLDRVRAAGFEADTEQAALERLLEANQYNDTYVERLRAAQQRQQQQIDQLMQALSRGGQPAQSQATPEQPQAKAEPDSPWRKIEQPNWQVIRAFQEVDETTGERRWKPNTPVEVQQQVVNWQAEVENRQLQMLTDPESFFMPMFERKVREMLDSGLGEYKQREQVQTEASAMWAELDDRMWQKDPRTGAPNTEMPTEFGQTAIQLWNEFEADLKADGIEPTQERLIRAVYRAMRPLMSGKQATSTPMPGAAGQATGQTGNGQQQAQQQTQANAETPSSEELREQQRRDHTRRRAQRAGGPRPGGGQPDAEEPRSNRGASQRHELVREFASGVFG